MGVALEGRRQRSPVARVTTVAGCEECGFVYDELDANAISGVLRSFGSRYRAALAGADPGAVAVRPEPATWSVVEYICHVRDLLLVQRDRAVLAQVEDRPSFARMYRDERVSICRYGAQPISEGLDQLSMAAELCALVFDGLDETVWARRLVYNWPAANETDLSWLGRHTVHEGEHHLVDVRTVLARVEAASAVESPDSRP